MQKRITMNAIMSLAFALGVSNRTAHYLIATDIKAPPSGRSNQRRLRKRARWNKAR